MSKSNSMMQLKQYTDKTKEQLVGELDSLRRRVAELEQSEAEYKRMEKELRESEEKYRSLVKNVRLGVFRSTPGAIGRFLEVNPAMEEITGYSREELLRINVCDLFMNPEERESVLEEMALAEGGVTKELNFRKKDGTKIVVSDTKTPIRDKEGKILYFDGIMEDVTERKRAEEALQASEEKLRLMFKSVTDGITVTDLNGAITEVNERTVEMHGFSSKDDLLGKSPFELIAAGDHERAKMNMRKTLEQGSVKDIEYTLLKADGSEFPGGLSASVLKDAAGNPLGFIAITKDITERKKMEEQLIVTDRLASIGELVSGIAHELNNPLTGVIGFSELLLERDVPNEIREDIAIVHNEAMRAANVVKNLLTFARKHTPSKQLVNINSIIASVLGLRAYEQKVNNIKVVKRLASDMPEVLADSFQLQQVFLNIVINAEYFMGEAHRGGVLLITTERERDIIRITFTDEGPGIREENLGHIFDPFFTTKEVGKGTGLGLSICHGIITEHGGRIYARSEIGKGASFIIELPISKDGNKGEE